MIFRIGLILLMIFNQANVTIASNCDCIIKNIELEKSIITEILVGRVIAKRINHQRKDNGREIGGIQNDIEVMQKIKGDFEKLDTIQILTGNTENICGFNFELDKIYLIYARYKFTDKCRRTKKIDDIYDDEINDLLNHDKIHLPPPPIAKRDLTALNEKQYYRFLHEYPKITISRCEWLEYEDLAKCNFGVSEEVSQYFLENIAERKTKQLFILYLNEDGDISSYKIHNRIGDLNKEEEEKIIQFIKENYEFITNGYGEMMSFGVFNVILEN